MAIMALGACSTKNEMQELSNGCPFPMGREIILSASCSAPDGGTKVVRTSDGKLCWSPGDKIYVDNYVYQNRSNEFVSLNTEPSRTASFTGTLYDFSENADDFYDRPIKVIIARFPSQWVFKKSVIGGYWEGAGEETHGFSRGMGVSEWTQDQYGDNMWPPKKLYTECTIPDIQMAIPGTFDRYLMPSMAISETTDLAFHHYAGGVKFSVSRPDIVSVSLRSANDEYFFGQHVFYIDYNTLEVDDHRGWKKSYRQMVLTAKEDETLIPGEYYYIVAFPRTFDSGIVLEMNTTDGEVITREISQPLEIKKAHFLVLNNIDSGIGSENPVGGGIDDFTFDPID